MSWESVREAKPLKFERIFPKLMLKDIQNKIEFQKNHKILIRWKGFQLKIRSLKNIDETWL